MSDMEQNAELKVKQLETQLSTVKEELEEHVQRSAEKNKDYDAKFTELFEQRNTQAITQEEGMRSKLPCQESTPQEYGSDDYYVRNGKEGYLLLLNSEKDRKGTEKDVDMIKDFFERTLKFKMEDPRSVQNNDLTTPELDESLEKAKQSLENSDYSCFICVMLFHGDKNTITTLDGKKPVDDIINFFSNKNIPSFTGRPKLFFISACRGDSPTGYVKTDVTVEPPPLSEGTVPIYNNADQTIRIPHVADILVAYSTTEGKFSIRNEVYGTWFISETIKVFKENYKKNHVEDMLITVRREVAGKYDPNNDTTQMPCVRTTLMKKLMLVPFSETR